MRKFVLIGVIAVNFLLISCGNQDSQSLNSGKSHKFSIEGKFINGPGRMLYLQKFGEENFISLDSTVLNETGEFSFRQETSSPEFFFLRTEEGQIINLIIYGREKVKIDADYNDILNYSVEGSVESEKIRQLNLETNKVITSIDKFNLIARDSMNSPDYPAIRVRNNEEYMAMMGGLRQYSQGFIEENSGSLITLLALYGQVGPQMMVFHPLKDMIVYEKTDSTLFAKYPNHPLVENLHEYIAMIKSQVAAQQESTSGTFSPGDEVPEIALASPEGKIIKLSSLRGKIVLLDFWAAWCQPCRNENPVLVENYARYNKKGFEIYQVSLDRTREDWLNGIKTDKLTWTHVSDLKYWESSVVSQFGIRGIPMNYLLDREGKVIAANLRGPALAEKLQELFNK